VEGLDFSVLLVTPLELLGLVQIKSGEWHYKSRPYQLLHWTIEPLLVFRIDQFDDGISLELEKVHVMGLGSMTDFVKVQGGILLGPALVGTRVKRRLELGVDRGGPLRMLPRFFLEKAVVAALKSAADRLDRTLQRRLAMLAITPGQASNPLVSEQFSVNSLLK
jgi:hypothetical protein